MDRPLCKCGNVKEMNGRRKNGSIIYRSACASCRKMGLKLKGSNCERCGFVPEDMVQLDVDHIDGDRSNNEPSNLQTLCANCHRLKTKIHMDWKGKHVKV
jgi:5-methylcytosine-specific restriction endonuclease McrA